MAYVRDEIGRAVGLPGVLGGIPLDELGATGFGLAVCADVLGEAKMLDIGGARVVIQGFGAVGRHTARLLAERGATVIAVSDSRGATWNAAGSTSRPCTRTRSPPARWQSSRAARRCRATTSSATAASFSFQRPSPTW
jgi:glutamate dehydrogenase (NAD(P)+)